MKGWWRRRRRWEEGELGEKGWRRKGRKYRKRGGYNKEVDK